MRPLAFAFAIALATGLSAPLQARADFADVGVSASPSAPAGVSSDAPMYDPDDGPPWFVVVGFACLYSVPVILFAVAMLYVSALVVGRLRDDRGDAAWLDSAVVTARRRALSPPRGVPLLRF